MQLLVRAFPVLPGREADIHRFAQEIRTTRAAESAEFYTRMGVARESWHLQETPHGKWVIAVTHIPEKPIEVAGQDYARAPHVFDRWFKSQVTLLTGVDP